MHIRRLSVERVQSRYYAHIHAARRRLIFPSTYDFSLTNQLRITVRFCVIIENVSLIIFQDYFINVLLLVSVRQCLLNERE